jgi:two-component system, OmpR family, response regulator AdeR
MAKPLVLIIEDAAELGEIFAEILELQGITTELISNGQAALTRLGQVVPDLIVLDMHLPGVPGIDILAYIRSQERFANCKIAAVTADILLVRELQNKADIALLKPISFDELAKLITYLPNRSAE